MGNFDFSRSLTLHESQHPSLILCEASQHQPPHMVFQLWDCSCRRRAAHRGDRDYGTTGTLLIPGTRLGVCNDKNGQIYLLDLDNLGGYQARAEVLAWLHCRCLIPGPDPDPDHNPHTDPR